MKSLNKPAWLLAIAISLGPTMAVAAGEQPAAAQPVVAAGATDPDAKSRDYFTDLELVTQDGEKVRFFTDMLKDQIVLINFIFTNCGDACPMMTHALTQVADGLDGEVGKSVRFISISIDPERDTPAAMKAFARKNGADREGWIFLTGVPANVNQVVKKLGQYTPDVEAHSTLVLAGNVNKRHWVKIPPNLSPPQVVQRMHEIMGRGIAGL